MQEHATTTEATTEDTTEEIPDVPKQSERRIFGRMKPYWVHCDLGYVLDISSDGVKLLSKRKLAGFARLRLWDEKMGVNHQAEVMWCKRIRFRQYEVGLRFVDLGPEVAQTLAIVASNFHR